MDLTAIDDLEFFEQISRSQSLTEAARNWGKSVSAVSKRLARLESRLGVPLVRRSTRRLTLTEEGHRYASGAAAILQQKTDLEEALSVQHGELKGRISVHSSLGIGRKHIAPLLGEFVRQHPLIQIDLQLSPLPLNISGTSFDIAIRVGGLSDSRLKAKLLARNRRIVCAAPSYIESAPPLRTIRDLELHNCIVLRENNPDYSLWRFGTDGHEYVDVRGSMISDDGDVVTNWCVQGIGLIMRSTWHVNPLIQQGVLQHVLPEIETPSADVFALYPAVTRTPRRITSAIEHLQQGLAARLGSSSSPAD
ncbi:LysR substrate-binding domain-containing protein [Sinomonas mesophila]|uniref:LysR substrate-binding domain-containing protein n=1 Tax=Sinomonas mesophila TaxID=1531955 RepID=UPI000986E916|nr:LysR substrate-binding domain-containing protein [Sinomonas mesophila]